MRTGNMSLGSAYRQLQSNQKERVRLKSIPVRLTTEKIKSQKTSKSTERN